MKEKLAAKVAEELRWEKNGMVEECWVHVHMGEELKGNRPLSKMRGKKRPVGGGTRLPCHLTHV